MIVYADASLLVPIFAVDTFTVRAMAFVRSVRPTVLLSDFAAAEFASAIARKARTGAVSTDEALSAFATFDAWAAVQAARVQVAPGDVSSAEGFVRRLDLNLRAPDAINIAMATRLGAELATFDERMAEAARALGCGVADL